MTDNEEYEEEKELDEEVHDKLEPELLEESEEESSLDSIEPETKAKKFGHVSKEEWEKQGRDPAKWKSPEEFNEFGDTYDKLKTHIEASFKKEISKRDTALDTIVSHIAEVREKEYLRGKQEVELRIKQAKEMGDVDAVEKLTEYKMSNERERTEVKQDTSINEIQAADTAFKENNKHWYNDQHPELVKAAQDAAVEIKGYYPNASFIDIAKKVEQRMKYDYPDIVAAGSRPKTPAAQSNRSIINKSSIESSPQNEDRQYRTMTASQRSDFNEVRRMVEQVPGLKYTVKEYLSTTNSQKRN